MFSLRIHFFYYISINSHLKRFFQNPFHSYHFFLLNDFFSTSILQTYLYWRFLSIWISLLMYLLIECLFFIWNSFFQKISSYHFPFSNDFILYCVRTNGCKRRFLLFVCIDFFLYLYNNRNLLIYNKLAFLAKTLAFIDIYNFYLKKGDLHIWMDISVRVEFQICCPIFIIVF